MFKIFDKSRQTLTKDIDTWIVEWTTYKIGCALKFPDPKVCYQAFTDRQEAEDFKDCLNGAMKVLGITSLPFAKVYKQERNSL